MIKTMVWMKLIIVIEDDCLSRLSYKMDVTYSHLTIIVNEFEKRGWIIRSKDGRRVTNTLTKKGHAVKEVCEKVFTELGQGVNFVR